MDRLTAMRVFIDIAERGSMSATADALDMSRPMVSRYLESLEAWLGVRLLHRTTRRLALTAPGEAALKACRDMVALADDMRAQAGEAGEVQGRLRLTSSPSFAEAQLTAAVVDFQALYPRVEIDLVMLDRTVDLVQDRIDLAIRLTNRIDEGLVSRQLAICRSVLCASPGYLARAGSPQVPADLAAHRCITHSNGLAPSYNLANGGKVTPWLRGARSRPTRPPSSRRPRWPVRESPCCRPTMWARNWHGGRSRRYWRTTPSTPSPSRPCTYRVATSRCRCAC